ncbi:MAG: bifunctional non-ous end joining protein LigD [Myxococcales bacterium]|nr:bifunctional non-ous end joining protein LigD [Myxococcales bacterium]
MTTIRQTMTISHPEKVLFPQDGITKGELAAYYQRVAPVMLPHIRQRPVTMERYPSGIDKKGFIQKDVSKGFPAWLERINVPKHGGSVNHPLINDERALLWMANQNCVTPHIWNRRAPDLAHPDLCVVDLDPEHDEPAVLRAAALAVRDLLAEHGLRSWVKTSGSKGFHIVAPLSDAGGADVERVATFAHELAMELVRRDPAHLTVEFSKADRGGRILVDTGRNNWSATFAAPYAVRPKAGAPVSAPCTWDEVERGTVAPRTFHLRNLPARIADAGDIWADIYEKPSTLP